MLFSFLRKNLALKIFSLLLALGLWAYVKYTSNPQAAIPTEAKVRIPIAYESVDERLVVLDSPKEVTLIVRAEPEAISKLDYRQFKAYVDLSDKKEGVYSTPVKVTTPHDIYKAKVLPEEVTVRLDPKEKRVFPVKITSQGTVAAGFMLGKMSSQPGSITVAGAQSLMSKVKAVRAVCDVEGADMDLVQKIGLEIIDENGIEIEGLKPEPKYIRASVYVRPEVISSTLPIHPNIKGSPAKGFKVSKISLVPSSVTVRYRYELEDPPSIITTEDISIEGIKSAKTIEAKLAPPNNISLIEPHGVKVKLEISRSK